MLEVGLVSISLILCCYTAWYVPLVASRARKLPLAANPAQPKNPIADNPSTGRVGNVKKGSKRLSEKGFEALARYPTEHEKSIHY